MLWVFGGGMQMNQAGKEGIVALTIGRCECIADTAAGDPSRQEMLAIIAGQFFGDFKVTRFAEPCRAADQRFDAEGAAGAVAPLHIAGYEINVVAEMPEAFEGATGGIEVAARCCFPMRLNLFSLTLQMR